jgi:hypothetical protein
MISECIRILCEDVAWQGDTLVRLLDLDANGTGAGGGAVGLAKHGKLGENFAIDLRDEVVLGVCFAAPDLPELNCLNSHVHRLMFGWMPVNVTR